MSNTFNELLGILWYSLPSLPIQREIAFFYLLHDVSSKWWGHPSLLTLKRHLAWQHGVLIKTKTNVSIKKKKSTVASSQCYPVITHQCTDLYTTTVCSKPHWFIFLFSCWTFASAIFLLCFWAESSGTKQWSFPVGFRKFSESWNMSLRVWQTRQLWQILKF